MSEKECDQCFETCEDDESLCEDCEEQERLEDEDEDEDEMETCGECGRDFYPEDLNAGVCDECEADLDDGVDDE